MTAVEHDIVAQVYAAKEDSGAADQFIQQYLPFIRSETAKFVGTAPDHRYEDELSIAMLAFYEAIPRLCPYTGRVPPLCGPGHQKPAHRLYPEGETSPERGFPSHPLRGGGTDVRGHPSRPKRPDGRNTTCGRPANRRSKSLAHNWHSSASPSPKWRTTAPSRHGP